MKNAIKAVKNSGMSIRGAATKFKVPRMTLSDKCKGKTPLARKMGPPTILDEDEENNLLKWILHLGENGFPVSKDHLLDSAQMLVKNRKRGTPFTDDRPRKHWYKGLELGSQKQILNNGLMKLKNTSRQKIFLVSF